MSEKELGYGKQSAKLVNGSLPVLLVELQRGNPLGNSLVFLVKLDTHSSDDTAITFLDSHHREMKTSVLMKTCTLILKQSDNQKTTNNTNTFPQVNGQVNCGSFIHTRDYC